MVFKTVTCCNTQAFCELNLTWQHMIDSILRMGQISLLCPNLSFDYLHTDLAADRPKMLIGMNAHTYALHVRERPPIYALLEEKICLYTIVLFFIRVQYGTPSYAARNRSRGLKSWLVKTLKMTIEWLYIQEGWVQQGFVLDHRSFFLQ